MLFRSASSVRKASGSGVIGTSVVVASSDGGGGWENPTVALRGGFLEASNAAARAAIPAPKGFCGTGVSVTDPPQVFRPLNWRENSTRCSYGALG